MEQNQNQFLLPASIIVAGIIIAGAVLYTPGQRNTGAEKNEQPAAAEKSIDYVELAGTLGMDKKLFKTCIDKHTYKDEIAKDQTDGSGAGVSGTPTTFINGVKVEGAVPYAAYKQAIDQALSVPKGAKVPPSQPGTDADDDRVLGNANAPVTVVVYGDYQCPFCGQSYRTAEKQLRAEYVDTGKVRMVFRDYPLTNLHPSAWPAAEASECANAQGKFWEYHDALFDNQDRLPLP